MAGKCAVVTGGAGGIGSAVARRLVEEGANVVCLDLDLATAEAAAATMTSGGGQAWGVACDATDEGQVTEALRRSIELMGQVDVLFMTAGGVATEEIKSFLDIEPDVWRTVVERNLTSVYLCSRVFGRHMVERGSGSIIATASQLGTVGHAGLAHYCSSKGGIIQLVKVMAVDLAATGVRVNAIAPGPTATPAVRAALDEMGEAYRKEMTANIPLGRFGEPEDMAGAVVFLASDDAAFITGSTVMVDGGYTIV